MFQTAFCFSQSILEVEYQLEAFEGSTEQALGFVQEYWECEFIYTNLVDLNQKSQLEPGVYSLRQVLDSLLIPNKIDYKVNDNTIVLVPSSQQRRGKIEIIGKVVDEKNVPISFASVYFKGTPIGTISNANGDFVIVIPDSLLLTNLSITSLGYEQVEINPNNYLKESPTIVLKQNRIKLEKVLVRPKNPEQLITLSLEKRKENYATTPLLYYGFFRETSQQEDNYISLAEAIIEIYKKPYLNTGQDLVKISRGRVGENISNARGINLIMKGGVFNLIQLDIVKYPVSFYSKEELVLYNYYMDKSILYKGRQTYVIRFKPKETTEVLSFEGKMYFDVETLGLARVEFEIPVRYMRQAYQLLIDKISSGFRAKPLVASYEMDYRFYNNKWHISHARGEVKIKAKSKRRTRQNFSCVFTSYSEFVVTNQVNYPEKTFKIKDASTRSDIVVEQLKTVQPIHWQGENVILPNEPLEKTIKRLSESNELRSYFNIESDELYK